MNDPIKEVRERAYAERATQSSEPTNAELLRRIKRLEELVEKLMQQQVPLHLRGTHRVDY